MGLVITTLCHNCESVGLKVGFQITTVGFFGRKWVFNSLLLVCWTRIGFVINYCGSVGLKVACSSAPSRGSGRFRVGLYSLVHYFGSFGLKVGL